MSSGEQSPLLLDDDQFERMLFESARHDESSVDVEAFWARLNTTIHGVAQLSAASTSIGGGSAFGGRLYRAIAAKWLMIGVIAGSVVTALTIGGARRWHRTEASREQSRAAALAELDAAPVSPPEPIQPPAPRFEESSKPRAPAPVSQRRTGSERAASKRSDRHLVPTRSQPDSTLGAQVTLLDAAQTAIASGMLAEALRLAEQYGREYPNGELAPEAEVVAIEALAARGDRVALTGRATRFLARYPSDPHAARVKWLAR